MINHFSVFGPLGYGPWGHSLCAGVEARDEQPLDRSRLRNLSLLYPSGWPPQHAAGKTTSQSAGSCSGVAERIAGGRLSPALELQPETRGHDQRRQGQVAQPTAGRGLPGRHAGVCGGQRRDGPVRHQCAHRAKDSFGGERPCRTRGHGHLRSVARNIANIARLVVFSVDSARRDTRIA